MSDNSDYLYGIVEDEDGSNGDEKWIVIVSKDHWVDHHRIDDQHISDELEMPTGLSEEMESHFKLYDGAEEVTDYGQIAELMDEAGFVHSMEVEHYF